MRFYFLTGLMLLGLLLGSDRSRRGAGTPSAAITTQQIYPNPLILNRADPSIYRHSDGYYYFTATVPEYDRIVLRRAPTIEGLATAQEKVIWRKHISGIMGSHIWAPEVHFIEGKWYIYFAAGGAEKIWDIRMYVLENSSPNPLQGQWIEKGQIKTQWESFSLDATTFENQGTRYLVWAQHDPSANRNTDLFIAKMDTPWSITGEPTRISWPQFDWEKQLFQVNEGPATLLHDGRIFVTYSASGTDWHYCLGMLSADENADLLDAKSWSKSPLPVFKTSEPNKIYGPGHNSFTTTPDGKTDLIVYHARDYKEIKGDALNDPNRHTRVQAFKWNSDGTPNFGEPLPATH